VKAIILGEKRTGSTFLQEVLRSHPDILSLDELFMGRPGYGTDVSRHGTHLFSNKIIQELGWSIEPHHALKAAEEYINNIMSQSDNVIFRLMYPQINDWKNNYSTNFDLLDIMRRFEISVIHIYRRNYLRTVLSHYLKQSYIETIASGKIIKCKLKPKDLYNDVIKYMRRHRKYKKQLRGMKVYDIAFEDILGRVEGDGYIEFHGQFNIRRSHQKNYMDEEEGKKLCNWIGVKYVEMYTNLSKLSGDNIWDYMENVDEIKELFKKKDLGYMCEL